MPGTPAALPHALRDPLRLTHTFSYHNLHTHIRTEPPLIPTTPKQTPDRTRARCGSTAAAPRCPCCPGAPTLRACCAR